MNVEKGGGFDHPSRKLFLIIYLDQAYDIITLLSNQTKKIPLAKFKYKPISFDLKGLLG